MTLDLLEEILNRFASVFNNISISSEGEPTVHKKFPEILKRCNQTNAQLSMVTNGVIPNKYIELIVKNLDSLMISLDGIDATTYHYKRGGNAPTFQKVLKTINRVNELKNVSNDIRLKDLSINFVIEKQSLHLIKPIIRFCADLGVHASLNNFIPIGDSTEWMPLMADASDVIEEYREITSINDWGTDIDLPRLVNGDKNNFCHFLFGRLPCNYKGDLSPCCYIPADPKYGNILDSDRPWDSMPLKEFRQSFTNAKSIEDLPVECRNCHARTSRRIYYNNATQKWSGLDALDRYAKSKT